MKLIDIYSTLEVGSTIDFSMAGYIPQEIVDTFSEEGFEISLVDNQDSGLDSGLVIEMVDEYTDGALRIEIFVMEFEIYITKLS